jgi:hypothetical protein
MSRRVLASLSLVVAGVLVLTGCGPDGGTCRPTQPGQISDTGSVC